MTDARNYRALSSASTTDTVAVRDLPSLCETAYEVIEAMIITGKLQPNTLFSESEVARILDCGRTPVPEALQRLSYEGFVHILLRRGITVTHFDGTQQLDRPEIRRPLEELIVRLARRRESLSQHETMRGCDNGFRDGCRKCGYRQLYPFQSQSRPPRRPIPLAMLCCIDT